MTDHIRLVGTVLLDRNDTLCGHILPLGNDEYTVIVDVDGGAGGRASDSRVPGRSWALTVARDMFDAMTGGYPDD